MADLGVLPISLPGAVLVEAWSSGRHLQSVAGCIVCASGHAACFFSSRIRRATPKDARIRCVLACSRRFSHLDDARVLSANGSSQEPHRAYPYSGTRRISYEVARGKPSLPRVENSGRPEKHRRRTRGSPQGNRPVGEIRETAALDRCSEGLAARGVSQHQVRQRHASHDFGSDRFRGNDPPQEGLLSPLAADGYRWWGGGGSSRRTDRASDLRASARSTPIDLGSTHPACGARGDSRVVIRRGGNPRWIVGVPTSLPLQSAATGSGSQCPARGAMVSLEAKLGHIASHSSLVSKLLALPPQPPQMNSSHSPVSEL